MPTQHRLAIVNRKHEASDFNISALHALLFMNATSTTRSQFVFPFQVKGQLTVDLEGKFLELAVVTVLLQVADGELFQRKSPLHSTKQSQILVVQSFHFIIQYHCRDHRNILYRKDGVHCFSSVLYIIT